MPNHANPTALEPSVTLEPQHNHTRTLSPGIISAIVAGVVLFVIAATSTAVVIHRRLRKQGHVQIQDTLAQPYPRCGDETQPHSRPSLTINEQTFPEPTSKGASPEVSPIPEVSCTVPRPLNTDYDYESIIDMTSPNPPYAAERLDRNVGHVRQGPYIVDATSFSVLVERVTRVILSDPELGRTSREDERPPRYEE